MTKYLTNTTRPLTEAPALNKSQPCSSKAYDDDAFVRKTQEAQLESLDSVRVPAINDAPSYAGRAYAAANPRETSQRKPWDNYKSRTPVDSGLEALLAAENPPTKEEKGSNGPF